MDKKAMVQAINEISRERGIEREVINAALEEVLFAAYMDVEGTEYPAKITITHSGAIYLDEYMGDDDEVDVASAPIESLVRSEIDFERGELGVRAAANVKRALANFLRDAQSEEILEYYEGLVGTCVRGRVESSERRGTLVSLPLGADGFVPASMRADNERLMRGRRELFYIEEIRTDRGTPEIILSRTNPRLVEGILEAHVPEVEQGLIRVLGVAREAGVRTLVLLEAEGIPAVATIKGMGNQRLRAINEDLRGPRTMAQQGNKSRPEPEHIEFIVRRNNYQDDMTKYVSSLFPRIVVRSVELERDANQEVTAAKVSVPAKDTPAATAMLGLSQQLVAFKLSLAVDETSASARRMRPVAEHLLKNVCTHRLKNGNNCPNQAEGESGLCAIHAQVKVVN